MILKFFAIFMMLCLFNGNSQELQIVPTLTQNGPAIGIIGVEKITVDMLQGILQGDDAVKNNLIALISTIINMYGGTEKLAGWLEPANSRAQKNDVCLLNEILLGKYTANNIACQTIKNKEIAVVSISREVDFSHRQPITKTLHFSISQGTILLEKII
ncbi:hypothetical protein FACS1894113_1070 [Alphaproteobacteria bacterium]|nr:hypothetical protein FACS1894113_1070 [Alphaproteobacteria bacterium]